MAFFVMVLLGTGVCFGLAIWKTEHHTRLLNKHAHELQMRNETIAANWRLHQMQAVDERGKHDKHASHS